MLLLVLIVVAKLAGPVKLDAATAATVGKAAEESEQKSHRALAAGAANVG